MVAEGLVVEEEEEEEEVEDDEDDDGVKPMRWWVMVLMLMLLLFVFVFFPFFSCLVLIDLVLVRERQVVDRKKKVNFLLEDLIYSVWFGLCCSDNDNNHNNHHHQSECLFKSAATVLAELDLNGNRFQ